MGSGIYLKEAKEKYGIKNFKKTIIIKDIISEEIINQLEKDFISIYRSLYKAEYNIADGGDGGGVRGRKFTMEKRHPFILILLQI